MGLLVANLPLASPVNPTLTVPLLSLVSNPIPTVSQVNPTLTAPLLNPVSQVNLIPTDLPAASLVPTLTAPLLNPVSLVNNPTPMEPPLVNLVSQVSLAPLVSPTPTGPPAASLVPTLMDSPNLELLVSLLHTVRNRPQANLTLTGSLNLDNLANLTPTDRPAVSLASPANPPLMEPSRLMPQASPTRMVSLSLSPANRHLMVNLANLVSLVSLATPRSSLANPVLMERSLVTLPSNQASQVVTLLSNQVNPVDILPSNQANQVVTHLSNQVNLVDILLSSLADTLLSNIRCRSNISDPLTTMPERTTDARPMFLPQESPRMSHSA
jgi:hypothetical protein